MNAGVLLEEPPARRNRGRKRQPAKLYLYKHGQVIPIVNKADLLAYIASMKRGK
jgi:hypothetical protein